MGMSIDTVTKWLEIIRANLKAFPLIGNSKKIESLDSAISYLDDYQQLMSKYQRIQEIVYGDWDKGYQYSETIVRIKRVLAEENKEHF